MAFILFVLLIFATFSHSHSLSAVTTRPVVSKTILPNTAVVYSTFTSVITSTTIQDEINTFTFGRFAATVTSEQDQIVYITSTIIATSQETGFTTSTVTLGLSTVYKNTESLSSAQHAPTGTTHRASATSAKSTSSTTSTGIAAAGAAATGSSQPSSTGLSAGTKAAIIAAIVVPVLLVGLALYIALIWRRRKEAAARRAQYVVEDLTADSAAVLPAAAKEEEDSGRKTNSPDSQRRLWDEKDGESIMSAFYPHPGVRPLEMIASTGFLPAPAPSASAHELSDSGTVRSNSRSTQATNGITALPRIPRTALTTLPHWRQNE